MNPKDCAAPMLCIYVSGGVCCCPADDSPVGEVSEEFCLKCKLRTPICTFCTNKGNEINKCMFCQNCNEFENKENP